MSSILITGGAGFIGSHVAAAYLDRGFEVVVLDNLATGKRHNLPAGVEFVELDIRDSAAAALIRDRRFDIISHHAAQADVRVSVADPRFDASVNIDGLINLLEAARASGVGRFVYVSSGGVVYGEPEHPPASERDPKVLFSPYGVTKLTGEYYLLYYHLVHGLDYVALRYSNVYGPRQDPHGEAGVVAIFSTRLVHGEPLTIFGDGDQTRDYVYVGDVVRANLLVGEVELPAARDIDDRAFNVGTGAETSVNDLARVLMDVSGRPGEPRKAPARAGEVQRSCLDPTKLRGLGWSPETTLGEGLAETFAWIERGTPNR